MPAKFFGRNAVLAITSAAALTMSLTAAQAAGFTAEQAAAGETAYQSNCSQCHGVKLEGPEAPALKGQDVMGNWDTAQGIYDFISVAMPPAAPGQLGDEAYVNIIAYIMRENGAEAGTEPMTADEAKLAAISLVAETKDGAAKAAPTEGAATTEEKIKVPQAFTWGKELPQAK